MIIKTDRAEIKLDEAALAHHVAAGNIPAEIAASWRDPDVWKKMEAHLDSTLEKLAWDPFDQLL